MELKNVRKFLKKGDRTLIAAKNGVSRALVYAVLAGNRHNEKILSDAIAVAMSRKQNKEKIVAEIKKL